MSVNRRQKSHLSLFAVPFYLWLGWIGLCLQPLVFWPSATIPHEVPKVWATIAGVMGIGFTLMVMLRRRPMPAITFHLPLLLAVMTFFSVAVLSSLLGEDIHKSVIGNPYRIDGLLTLSVLIAASLLISFWQTSQWRKYFVWSMWSGAGLVSTWAVIDFVRLHVLNMESVYNWQGAIGVSFGQPNFLAGYLLCCLPLGWYLYRVADTQLVKGGVVLTLVILILALLGTYSLGAIAGLGVATCLLYILTKDYSPVWGLGTILLAALLFNTIAIWKDQTTAIAESRTRIFKHVSTGYLAQPVFGWGVANVDYAFRYSALREGFYHDVYLDKAHSELLEVLVTTGVVGLISYSLLLGVAYLQLVKQTRKANATDRVWYQMLMLCFLLYVYHSQTNVISISEHLIFWFVVGAVLIEQKAS
ncbi:MAG TPA: O-antigen ligase family protein [Vitreimonas sp.]|nr:O-antigen ligase family protein [Vitreimonas sp.]